MSCLRVLTILAAIILSTFLGQVAHADGQDKSIIGRWKFTKVLDSADISALSDEQAEALIGQVFIIESHKIRFGNRSCDNPDFNVTVADRDKYLEEQFHATAENLALPDQVTAVDVDCTTVFKKGPDKLLVFWKGVFFDAVRVRTPSKN